MGEVKGTTSSLLSLIQNRVSLFAVELEMEKYRLLTLVLTALIALFFLGFGILFAVFAIALAFWDVYGLWVLGAFAIVFLVAGALFLWSAYGQKKRPSVLFSTSLAELHRDQQAVEEDE